MNVDQCLADMRAEYQRNPVAAVRGQSFIKILHRLLKEDLESRLSKTSLRRGVRVVLEANILGSHKPKKVDVAVIDPTTGPLMLIGVRSQMSSVGKNFPNYYEGIIGECISLQDRCPLAVFGYVYLMPIRPIKAGRQTEAPDHPRYAQAYAAIAGRGGQDYKSVRGVYDQFAYMIVDFAQNPPTVRNDLIPTDIRPMLQIDTFTERLVETFKSRHLFVDVFK